MDNGPRVSVIGSSACFLSRVLASDGSGYPQSIPVDNSRLLYDVPTDDPERSRPVPPGSQVHSVGRG